jgi:hypothetical protein
MLSIAISLPIIFYFDINIPSTMPPKSSRPDEGATSSAPDIIPLTSVSVTSTGNGKGNKNKQTQKQQQSVIDDGDELKPSERQGVIYLGQ